MKSIKVRLTVVGEARVVWPNWAPTSSSTDPGESCWMTYVCCVGECIGWY